MIDLSRMSSCWKLCYDLERRECPWGKCHLNFSCQGCRATYVTSPKAFSRQSWTFCWGLCFPDILLQRRIIFFSVLLKPSQTARLNDMVAKSTTAMCFYPLSSEVIMMPRCQPVKFYNSEQGLNSGQHSGAEIYPTNGLGSLCLLIGIWNKSPITFFQMTARRKLHVLLSYI